MTKVKHPIFKDVELDVDSDDLSEWLASGWLEENKRRKATVNTEPEQNDSPATAESK